MLQSFNVNRGALSWARLETIVFGVSHFTVLSVMDIPDNATHVDQNKPFEMTCSVRNSDCEVGGHHSDTSELQQLNLSEASWFYFCSQALWA